MAALKRWLMMLQLSDSLHIARRYFVTNGFDGALTMLGLVTGFRLSGESSLEVALWACIGTGVALATSGVSSAYISESAERQRALRALEGAMASRSLAESAHGRAARFAPFFVAVVNGGSPLLLALLITLPVWLARNGVALPLEPFDMAIAISFLEIALLGAFLGKVAENNWFLMSLKTLAVAVATAAIILLIGS